MDIMDFFKFTVFIKNIVDYVDDFVRFYFTRRLISCYKILNRKFAYFYMMGINLPYKT